MNQKYKEVQHFAQCHSAGKKQSHNLNPRKNGFRICNKLPSNKVLLDGEAGNAHNHINDHKTHFVLNIKLMLTSCWLWKHFAAKCWGAWRSGLWWARGQVNMADEAKLCSPIRSTFEAWIVAQFVQLLWHAVGHCGGEELGPFCWPILAAGIAVFSAPHQFAEHTSQL